MPQETFCLWRQGLANFISVICHVSGERNVWSDMLTRWAEQNMNYLKSFTVAGMKEMMITSISPELDENIDCSRECEIRGIQQVEVKPSPYTFGPGKPIIIVGHIWIPPQVPSMQLRILFAANFGIRGHSGIQHIKHNLSN